MLTLIRNILVIGSSNVLQFGSVFLRGVILARILGVQQFGLAVIIISVTGALDLFADAGIDRFIVQHRFGYRDDIIATSHTFRLVGSAVVGLLIAITAYPLAFVFHAHELWAPIAATGGVVTLRGMANLSYKVQQRDHRFEKETIIDASRVGADLLVTVLVALRTHSYLAVLAGAYANAGVHLILSHIRPSNPYQFIPRRQLIRLVGRFSMPIYVNAAMLFAAMQGDRMVVASMFSKRQLALYAIACTLGQGSAQLLSKVIEKLLLPILTARSRSLAARRTQASRIGGLIIAGSALFFAGIGMWGPGLIPVIYGPVYGGLRNLVVASAIFQMIQIQQSWLTSLLISNGSTAAIPKITMMRAVAFPAAVIFASFGLSLVAIPLAFALGAALSLGVSYYATRSLGLVDKRLMLTSFLLIAAAILLAVWFSLGGQK